MIESRNSGNTTCLSLTKWTETIDILDAMHEAWSYFNARYGYMGKRGPLSAQKWDQLPKEVRDKLEQLKSEDLKDARIRW